MYLIQSATMLSCLSRPAGVGSSWYASVFLVVNAGLGAGLLNFPAAFDQSGGMLVAILMQAVNMHNAELSRLFK